MTFLLLLLFQDRTLIHAGKLIDGVSNEAKSEMTVVIKDKKFVAVEKGYSKPQKDDRVIDLKGSTVMPGLMDMHVHLTIQISPRSYSDKSTMDPADFAFRAVPWAEKTLMAGFTTVRNLGDEYDVTISMRDAIKAGHIDGPRIFTAGKSIATTGGHADPSNGFNDRHSWEPHPEGGVVNGPDEAAQAVRQRYKTKADLIKITATGGVLSLAKSGLNPQFFQEEVDAIIRTAKDYEFTVAAHAHGAEGMKRAVLAGVDSIEHGTYMTQEIMDLMKERGTWYVPTITAGVFVGEKAEEPGYFPEIVRPKAASIGPQIKDTAAKAIKAGVPIAFGTDSGVSPHGENWKEFIYLVECGMTPMQAIQAATMSAARLLKEDQTLGSVETGKWADLVAVEGDPLKDISIMGKVSFVMKEGHIFKGN